MTNEERIKKDYPNYDFKFLLSGAEYSDGEIYINNVSTNIWIQEQAWYGDDDFNYNWIRDEIKDFLMSLDPTMKLDFYIISQNETPHS